MNRAMLVGRLTKDCELAYTQSGYAVTKLSIAVNKRRKKGDNWEDEANYFDITLWGKRGESLQPYLVKGQQVAIDGQLKQDRWEKDGNKRSRVLIEANDIQLLGSKKDNQQSGAFTEDVPFM